MADDVLPPRQYPGVMVSSTFLDLKQHRVALMNAINGQGLHAVGMEHDAAPLDVRTAERQHVPGGRGLLQRYKRRRRGLRRAKLNR